MAAEEADDRTLPGCRADTRDPAAAPTGFSAARGQGHVRVRGRLRDPRDHLRPDAERYAGRHRHATARRADRRGHRGPGRRRLAAVWIARSCENGKNWARVAGTVICVIGVSGAIYDLGSNPGAAARVFSGIDGLKGLLVVVLLWLGSSNDYFRSCQRPRCAPSRRGALPMKLMAAFEPIWNPEPAACPSRVVYTIVHTFNGTYADIAINPNGQIDRIRPTNSTGRTIGRCPVLTISFG